MWALPSPVLICAEGAEENFASCTKGAENIFQFATKAPKKSFRRRRRRIFLSKPKPGPSEPKWGPSRAQTRGPQLKPKPGPPRAQARAPLEPKPGPPLATNPRTNCTVPTHPNMTTKKKTKKTSACAAWCTLSLCLRATPLAEHFPFGHHHPPNSEIYIYIYCMHMYIYYIYTYIRYTL